MMNVRIMKVLHRWVPWNHGLLCTASWDHSYSLWLKTCRNRNSIWCWNPRILEGHYLLKQVSACTQLIKYEIYEQLYATHYLLETNFQLAFIHWTRWFHRFRLIGWDELNFHLDLTKCQISVCILYNSSSWMVKPRILATLEPAHLRPRYDTSA